MTLEMHLSLTVHVGDRLKTEIVEPTSISVKDLADHFGVSRQALSTIAQWQRWLVSRHGDPL